MTQLVGMVAALGLAILLNEPFPSAPDIAWAVVGGLFGVVGITSLYRGLAVGRMGVVAPVTGVLSATVPVAFGFLTEGLPAPATVVGIAVALVAVVLVTRTPGEGIDRPSGIRWALIAGAAIGLFNVCVGQFSGDSAFGLLVIVRLVQALVLGGRDRGRAPAVAPHVRRRAQARPHRPARHGRQRGVHPRGRRRATSRSPPCCRRSTPSSRCCWRSRSCASA